MDVFTYFDRLRHSNKIDTVKWDSEYARVFVVCVFIVEDYALELNGAAWTKIDDITVQVTFKLLDFPSKQSSKLVDISTMIG
ncbi:hypothetical protein DPMN_007453, partial [Dreissena polymorpha]